MPTRIRQRKAPKIPVKIDRVKRRFLHAIFPPLFMGTVNRAASELRYHVRTSADGLTPKEKEFLDRKVLELEKISADLARVYFRLKF